MFLGFLLHLLLGYIRNLVHEYVCVYRHPLIKTLPLSKREFSEIYGISYCIRGSFIVTFKNILGRSEDYRGIHARLPTGLGAFIRKGHQDKRRLVRESFDECISFLHCPFMPTINYIYSYL